MTLRGRLLAAFMLLGSGIASCARAQEQQRECDALAAETLELAQQCLRVPYVVHNGIFRRAMGEEEDPLDGMAFARPGRYGAADPAFARRLRKLWQRDTDELASVATRFVHDMPSTIGPVENVQWLFIDSVVDRLVKKRRREPALALRAAILVRYEHEQNRNFLWGIENARARLDQLVAPNIPRERGGRR